MPSETANGIQTASSSNRHSRAGGNPGLLTAIFKVYKRDYGFE
ncbi:hypothetical protein [Neisseria meningitidis]|nr:hypothetical protein [Neisseria meningitidis]